MCIRDSYYCMRNEHCSIVLLAPSTCEEGLPSIDKLTVVDVYKRQDVPLTMTTGL